MNDEYLTIKKETQAMYKEKGSKFIAYAFPVNTEDAIKQHIEALKKEHHNANHHCYAFIIGKQKKYYRSNDDGEPSHSAGDPILRQIQSHDLTNTLVVVVRYFGGTKLGVGGLVSAYKAAAHEALRKNIITCEYVKQQISMQYEYSQTNFVMKLIDEFNADIDQQEFQASCKVTISIRASNVAHLIERLKDADVFHQLIGNE